MFVKRFQVLHTSVVVLGSPQLRSTAIHIRAIRGTVGKEPICWSSTLGEHDRLEIRPMARRGSATRVFRAWLRYNNPSSVPDPNSCCEASFPRMCV